MHAHLGRVGDQPFAPESPSQLNFSAGALFIPSENLTFSALIGTAAGHDSPDLTSSLGVTFAF
jgi:hypothetical protein